MNCNSIGSRLPDVAWSRLNLSGKDALNVIPFKLWNNLFLRVDLPADRNARSPKQPILIRRHFRGVIDIEREFQVDPCARLARVRRIVVPFPIGCLAHQHSPFLRGRQLQRAQVYLFLGKRIGDAARLAKQDRIRQQAFGVHPYLLIGRAGEQGVGGIGGLALFEFGPVW